MLFLNEPGKKVKAIGSVIFIIGIVIALLVLIASLLFEEPLLGFLAAVLIVFLFWLSALSMVLIGQMGQDLQKQTELLEKIAREAKSDEKTENVLT